MISIQKYYSQTNSTLYFIGLNNCPNPSDKCLQGLMGGKTHRYQEFRIPVNTQERTLGNITFVFEYNKLVTMKHRVDRVVNLGGYYMLIGDFGKMETSKAIIEANKELPDIAKITEYKPTQRILQSENISPSAPGQVLPSSLGQGGTVERVAQLKKKESIALDAGTMEDVKHLIYRKGDAEPFLRDAFMRGYGDTDYAKFEMEKNEVLYVTKRANSLKYYKISDF